MKKLSCVFYVMMILCSSVSAQDHLYNKVWIYGGLNGIDFNSGVPEPIASKMNQLEGIACASGPDGRLLFYTDGMTIWNGLHEVMPDGSKLQPYSTFSTSQATVIVPMPDSAKYYVFSLTETDVDKPIRLFYTVVRLAADGCNWEVDPARKGILLDDVRLSEKMTAVRGESCNVWLLVHEVDQPVFKSYEITGKGLNPVPVVSRVAASPPVSYRFGVMKASPDRRKLALANQKVNSLEEYDFDPVTGRVSGGTELYNGGSSVYSVCFSPDNSKLYASLGNDIMQFNLSLSDPDLIRSSRTDISANVPHPSEGLFKDMQIGPDNKIYAGGAIITLFVIQHPDEVGMASGFERTLFRWKGNGTYYGAPNSLPVLQAKDTVRSKRMVALSGCFSGPFTLKPESGRDHIWEDESTCVIRTVTKPGIYVARYLGTSCTYHIDTFIVPDVPRLVYPEKCHPVNNAWFQTLAVDDTRWEYKWQDADGKVIRLFTGGKGDTIKNLPTGSYAVRIESSYGCVKTMTFDVVKAPVITLSSDYEALCSGNKVQFGSTSSEAAGSYYWNFDDGSTAASASPSHTFKGYGIYKVRHSQVSKAGCRSDTLTKEIRVYRVPVVKAGADTIAIAGEPVILKGETDVGSANIQWTPAAYLSNSRILRPVATPPYTQIYSLKATGEGGCYATDEVTVTILEKIQIPNAFSPNNDGINDKWEIPGLSGYIHGSVKVFNRWGQQVFESKGYNSSWDGRQNGKPLPAGTYYYIIDPESPNVKGVFQGTVTIIR